MKTLKGGEDRNQRRNSHLSKPAIFCNNRSINDDEEANSPHRMHEEPTEIMPDRVFRNRRKEIESADAPIIKGQASVRLRHHLGSLISPNHASTLIAPSAQVNQ